MLIFVDIYYLRNETDMKRFLKIALLCVLGLVLAFFALTWIKFGSLIKGSASVQKLDEGLYYMEYKGDDGFAELMENGGGRSACELVSYVMDFLSKGYYKVPEPSPAAAGYGCSALTAKTPDNTVLMGRNFDFDYATAVILHTIPDKGYETYTTFNVDFFGFGENWLPEGYPNQYMALSSLFFALDGINEKGLAVADLMAGDNAETHQNTGKPGVTTTSAICYMLKKAATVDEAIGLLRGVDMHSDIGAAHHYAISDASGRSVVVEYVDNEFVVVETQAVANHYLCEKKLNAGLVPGDHRYEQLCAKLAETDGIMDRSQFEKAVFSVSQPENGDFLGTAWTMVMDLTNPSVTYYSRRHFDKPFHFELTRSK